MENCTNFLLGEMLNFHVLKIMFVHENDKTVSPEQPYDSSRVHIKQAELQFYVQKAGIRLYMTGKLTNHVFFRLKRLIFLLKVAGVHFNSLEVLEVSRQPKTKSTIKQPVKNLTNTPWGNFFYRGVWASLELKKRKTKTKIEFEKNPSI